jgi:hypothetical protein
MALTALDMVAAAKQQIKEIDAATAQSQLGSSLILDVREPAEFAAGFSGQTANSYCSLLPNRRPISPGYAGTESTRLCAGC